MLGLLEQAAAVPMPRSLNRSSGRRSPGASSVSSKNPARMSPSGDDADPGLIRPRMKREALKDMSAMARQLNILKHGVLKDTESSEGPSIVKERLASTPLFKECDALLPYRLAEEAERKHLIAGEELEFINDRHAIIIEKGELEITVGQGPPTFLGPGEVFNWVGFLQLAHEVEPFKPSAKEMSLQAGKIRAGCGGPYQVYPAVATPLSIFNERQGRPNLTVGPRAGEACVEDSLCFFALCPQAVYKANPPANNPRLKDWLPLRVRARPRDPGDLTGQDCEEVDDGDADEDDGVEVAVLSMKQVDQLGLSLGDESGQAKVIRKGLQVFRNTTRRLANIWRSLMSRAGSVFPGIPPEVMWNVAETVQRFEVDAGEVFVQEGDPCQDLLLIEEGLAIVEKAVANGKIPSTVVVGELGPGAVIGDMGLIGSGLSRPCQVRAKSLCEVLCIPASGLLAVLRRFPGMLDGVTPRIREAGSFLQMKMPVKNEVLSCLDHFKDCDPTIRNEVAARTKRILYIVGDIVTDGSLTLDDNIYVLESGECVLENSQTKQELARISAITCFSVGDTLAGKPEFPRATVRVLTPHATLLVIHAKELQEALQRHSDKIPSPFELEKVLKPGPNLHSLVKSAEIFSKCSAEFVAELCIGIEHRSYMPGQTLAMKSGQDASQMFLLRGGTLILEKDGKRNVCDGNVIGDLVMLGAVHHREATIRAQSFCFTAEIPRAVFLEALENHPTDRRHLEAYGLRAMGDSAIEEEGVVWPMQHQAPKRLGYLLNLFAGRRFYEPGDVQLKTLAEECAVLVVSGEAAIVYEDEENEEVITSGACFNEQVLLGLPGGSAAGDGRLELRTVCELQFVSSEVWKKVISEFPEEQCMVFDVIRQCMADKAATKKHGYPQGSADVVRMSRLLRSLSDEAVEALKDQFASLVIRPETKISTKGSADRCLYILLSGTVYVEEGKGDSLRRVEYSAGKVWGEAEILGVSKVYNSTVISANTCILQALRISDFWSVLCDFPQDCVLLEPLCIDTDNNEEITCLQDRVMHAPALEAAMTAFVTEVSLHAEDAFYGPGEAVIMFGDECTYGQCEFYLLLAGDAVVESDLGVEQTHLRKGEIFGEAGALGLASRRITTVRAPPTGCLHCIRFNGKSIQSAFKKFPQETEHFDDLFAKRQEINDQFQIRRDKWLEEKAIPALAAASLFRNFGKKFLADVAAPLIEMKYQAGDIIASKASHADSMLIVLEGQAQAETQNGEPLGVYRTGSSLGEMAALGLLESRPAAIRASTACKVLVVKGRALQRALSLPERTEAERLAFEGLLAGRREQVAHGLPMSALPINIKEDDLCAKAIAIQAEEILIQPGECWMPLSDRTPWGAAFTILTEGQGLLELASENPRLRRLGGVDSSPAVPVLALAAGSLILEGMVAAYGCRVRALTATKAYRVRYIDFDVAVHLESCSTEWLARFRMLESDMAQQLTHRSSSARGVVDALMEHPCDNEIHDLRDRKKKAVSLARKAKMKTDRLDSVLGGGSVSMSRTGSTSRLLPAKGGKMLRKDLSAPSLSKTSRDRFKLGASSIYSSVGANISAISSVFSSPAASMRLPKLSKNSVTPVP